MSGGANKPEMNYNILYASENMYKFKYEHTEKEINLINQFTNKCVNPEEKTIKINFQIKESTGGTIETLILQLNNKLKNITFGELENIIEKVVLLYNKTLITKTRTFFGYFGNDEHKKYAMGQNLSELETDKITKLKYT